jgi:hypothetical protein
VLLLLNQNLYKWRTTSRVWCLNFYCEGVFIGVNGTSLDLERSAWCRVVAGRPSHVASRPGGVTSTDSAFSSSCRCVAAKARAEPPQTLAGWPWSWVSQQSPRHTRPGVWPSWSTCQIHPRGDNDFDIWSISLCHPLKWSNLVHMFLKLNKH